MNFKPCRILYILQPGGGGAATSLYDLVAALDKTRYTPYVLFFEPDYYCEKFRKIGARVFVLNQTYPLLDRVLYYNLTDHIRKRFGKLIWKFYWLAHVTYLVTRVMMIVHAHRINIIHHNDNILKDRFTILAGKLAGVKQVCHLRSCCDLSSSFRQQMAASVDTFIYVSQWVEEYYLKEGIPATKGQVNYEGFDLTSFEQVTPAQTAAVRAEFGIEKTDILISNVGRIDVWKGQDDFIQAIAQVTQLYPRIKALIVGQRDVNPNPKDQVYLNKLDALVTDLNLEKQVIFTGFRPETAAIMAASDIVVHASSEPEPFGRVPIEAMLVGRPVIATAIGEPCKTVLDGLTGVLVPPKDPTAMAQAILRLVQNGEEANQMGVQARHYAREQFSINRHVEFVQQTYDQLLRIVD